MVAVMVSSHTEECNHYPSSIGIDTEDSYPYDAEDETCKFKKSDVAAEDTGFVDVPDSEEKLKEAVATVGPVSIAIDASHSSFQMYRSGKRPS